MNENYSIGVILLAGAATLIAAIIILNVIALVEKNSEEPSPEYTYLGTMEYDIAGYDKSLYVIEYLVDDKIRRFEVRGDLGRDVIYEKFGGGE